MVVLHEFNCRLLKDGLQKREKVRETVPVESHMHVLGVGDEGRE